MFIDRIRSIVREFGYLGVSGKIIFLLNIVLVGVLIDVLIFNVWNFSSYFATQELAAKSPFFLEMVAAHGLTCLIFFLWLMIVYRSGIRVLASFRGLLFNCIPLLVILLYSVVYLASR